MDFQVEQKISNLIKQQFPDFYDTEGPVMIEAFVYMWQDKLTDKYYIGAHKGTSDDGYVCSSKLMLEEYNARVNDFKKVILAEGSWNDMFAIEGQLLEYFDVKNNKKFYNMHNGNGDFRNKGHSEKTKEKIRNSNKGKHVISGELHPLYGKKMSEEFSIMLSDRNNERIEKGIHQFLEINGGSELAKKREKKRIENKTHHLLKENAGDFQKKLSTQRVKDGTHNFLTPIIVTCPHCGKTGSKGPMNVWHFNKCRKKR